MGNISGDKYELGQCGIPSKSNLAFDDDHHNLMKQVGS
jgi:hypothetical protein